MECRFHAALAAMALLAGCSGVPGGQFFGQGGGNLPVLTSASVTENRTPVDDALVCFGAALSQARGRRAPLSIGVGEVRDFTGRITEGEGAPITQGAALMVYSALASVGPAVRVHERLDPRISELELAYIERRQLGDGRMHEAAPGAPPAPWLPYMGGSILQSDYFIVGGVTEINYVLSTGGVEAVVSGIGARTRFITINVAVDLRIVNTRNLVVEHAVSMQKQVIGREAALDIFRFFGTRLFDISGGARMSEPMQMAVRSVLQLATLDLLEAVSGVPNEACVRQVQPDLDRRQPRPQRPASSRNWPPDAGTAVSAERVREAARQERAARAAAVQPAPAPVEPRRVEAPRRENGASVIGAATNAEAASGLWRRLREAHGELLGTVQADMVSVQADNGPFLLVVVHPRLSAADFCTAAGEAGIDCAVAPPEVLQARARARADSGGG
jgi:curli biogenesis system outer membrane secretion channel CsgG